MLTRNVNDAKHTMNQRADNRKEWLEKRRGSRRLRSIAMLPTLLTLLNGVCGFASIHFTARGMNHPGSLWLEKPALTFFAAAAWLIFLGMLADALDGFLARMAGSASHFGGQLDSLCDMVTFGIAPAFLMLRVVESHFGADLGPASPAFSSLQGKLLWLAAALYVCCAALRLARFNVEHGPEEADHEGFSGLPSPAAAGVLAALVLVYGDWANAGLVARPIREVIGGTIPWILGFLTALLGVLMVSRLGYLHLVNRYMRGKRPFSHVVLMMVAILVFLFQPQPTIAVAFLAYAVSGPVGKLRRKKRSAPTESPQG
ncbi:MAG: phosphatidylcholine/phosphatidylserine synthase [Sedimentisphaerales bacterium]|nr:phosphatidylcholine/phosphatidylserine synthase [Sedimentisphaerales bacterium]